MVTPWVVVVGETRVSAGFIRVSRRMRDGRQVCRVHSVVVRGSNERRRLRSGLRRRSGIWKRSLPADHSAGGYGSWSTWQRWLKPVHMALNRSRACITRSLHAMLCPQHTHSVSFLSRLDHMEHLQYIGVCLDQKAGGDYSGLTRLRAAVALHE